VNRAVLDLNVLVSGLICPFGPPGQIMDMIRAESLQPVVDDRILAEYHAVLHRPRLQRYFDSAEVEHILKFLQTDAHGVVCTPTGRYLPDPRDIAFLETALTSGDILITGNLKQFPADSVSPASVLSPAQFIHHMTGK